ncbi:MAG: hypothetical protein KIC80_08065 [Brachyspira sp.]|nr:hypothetical protein [Brachyspira sp.]
MLKKFILFAAAVMFVQPVLAETFFEGEAAVENTIQSRIDNVGTTLLNCNKIPHRIIFVYDKKEKKKLISLDKDLTSRQVVVYDGLYKSVQTDDELAAMLAREISVAVKSYSGIWGGTLDSVQVALGSKKFETVADKRSVDYMVNSGYNPLALIVFINKTCPQKRFDRFSRHNLTSKRLARIYEYITYKYPQYLENNDYVNNKYYQNFLLTSLSNRRKLEEKIKNRSTEEVDYD